MGLPLHLKGGTGPRGDLCSWRYGSPVGSGTLPDNGFSRALVAKITAQERTVIWFEWGTAAVLVVPVLFSHPGGA